MYKYTPIVFPSSLIRFTSPTSNYQNMSRASSPILVPSRDSTPTPEPIDREAIRATAEGSRAYHQELVVGLNNDTASGLRRAASHGAIIGHWANLFGAPVSEVLRNLAGSPSIAQPLMLGGPSPPRVPSPTLTYPEYPSSEEEEEAEVESALSTPPIPIPPPITLPVLVAAFANQLAQNDDIIGPNREPITPTDPVPSFPSSPPPFIAAGPADEPPPFVDHAVNVLVQHEVQALTAAFEREEEERQRTPSPSGPQPGVHPGPGWSVNFTDPGVRYVFPILNMGSEREIAPFVQIDWTSLNPELLGTMGRGCPVYSKDLHARPDPTPRPAYDQ
jgi:hypothetical protein